MMLVQNARCFILSCLVTALSACSDGDKPEVGPTAPQREKDAQSGAVEGAREDAATSDETVAQTTADAGAREPSASDATSGPQSDAGNEPARDAQSPERDASVPGRDAGASARRCDRRGVLCRRAEPVCPEGQVVEIVDNCFGDCVRIDQCPCSEPVECPQPDKYTCHRSKMRCDYFVN